MSANIPDLGKACWPLPVSELQLESHDQTLKRIHEDILWGQHVFQTET